MAEPPRLRPQEIVEILDSSFRLYRENFALFIGVVALIYIPAQILQMVITGPISLELGTLMAQMQAQSRANPNAPDMSIMKQVIGHSSMLLLVTALVSGIAFPIAACALTKAVSRRVLNEATSLRECYGFVFRNFGRYVGTILLNGLAIGLGLMCCVVPGILLGIWFVFTAYVVVIEGQGGTAAMGRSRELSRGQGWRIVGLFVILIVVSLALTFSINAFSGYAIQRMDLQPLHQFMAQQALQDVLHLLLTPFFSIGWILLYYDVRIRNEGYDLEVRMTAPAAVVPAPEGPSPAPPAAA